MKKFPFLLLYPFVYRIAILRTLYFNLYYFPIKVAIKLPVMLHKGTKLLQMNGRVELASDRIKPGMVHIGRAVYGFHTKHHQTIWEQKVGKVSFGRCVVLGKGTFVSVGYNGDLVFGNRVRFGGNSKIICRKHINIGESTMVSWDAQIIDTDFHSTLNTIFKTRNSAERSILIGTHNWLGFGCTLLKGTKTPNHCIVGANTTLKSDYSESPENIVLAYEQNASVTVKYITFDERSEANFPDDMPDMIEPEFQIGKMKPNRKSG
jgi:acetyltransferase-like isoleucine patch superfamily enzyme